MPRPTATQIMEKFEALAWTPSVLIIDDSIECRLSIRLALESFGAHVVECEDGETGVQVALLGKFDLILLDLRLPRMDGADVLRHLKQNRYERPVTIITGHPDGPELLRALSIWPVLTICTKPLDHEVIARLLCDLQLIDHETRGHQGINSGNSPELKNSRT